MKIYSGIFFDSGLHMTYDFNPKDGPRLPHGVEEGDKQWVKITGILMNDRFGVAKIDRVYYDWERPIWGGTSYPATGLITNQHNSDTPLHITFYTAPDVNPVETGRYLMNNSSRNKLKETDFSLNGKWGYYESK